MPPVHLTEALPEGTHAAWLTFDDAVTRLVDLRPLAQRAGYEALGLPMLRRAFYLEGDGAYLVWPGGAYLRATDLAAGRAGVTLMARMPSHRRYRPLAALLRHQTNLSQYLDVRPKTVLQNYLRLKPGDMKQFLHSHEPVAPDLCVARLSDLTVALQTLLPGALLPALLRQPWPYLNLHSLQRHMGDTALNCLWSGRIDLIDTPLARLLVPDVAVPSVLVSSDAESHGAAPTAQQRRHPEGQRDR